MFKTFHAVIFYYFKIQDTIFVRNPVQNFKKLSIILLKLKVV